MATYALSPSALSSPIVGTDDVPSRQVVSSQPSLMRRLYDAFTAAQMRRAQREVDRILGSGAFRHALRTPLPPGR